jgi:hypothetical protein
LWFRFFFCSWWTKPKTTVPKSCHTTAPNLRNTRSWDKRRNVAWVPERKRGLDYIPASVFIIIIIGETSPEIGIKNLNIRKLSDFEGFQSTEMREFFF